MTDETPAHRTAELPPVAAETTLTDGQRVSDALSDETPAHRTAELPAVAVDDASDEAPQPAQTDAPDQKPTAADPSDLTSEE